MAHAKANKEGSYKNQFEINGVADTDWNYLAQGKSLMLGLVMTVIKITQTHKTGRTLINKSCYSLSFNYMLHNNKNHSLTFEYTVKPA